jgi:hypothetical protein
MYIIGQSALKFLEIYVPARQGEEEVEGGDVSLCGGGPPCTADAGTGAMAMAMQGQDKGRSGQEREMGGGATTSLSDCRRSCWHSV